jgi:hypothetical protein
LGHVCWICCAMFVIYFGPRLLVMLGHFLDMLGHFCWICWAMFVSYIGPYLLVMLGHVC